MFQELSLFLKSIMISPYSTVYVPQYSICSKSTVYVSTVLFMCLKDSLCP